MERRIVELMLQARRDAAITGSTMSAAIRRIPTMRMETAIVTPASAASRTFRRVTGIPLTRAPSASSETATRPRYKPATRARPAAPSTATRARSSALTVRMEPKRKAKRFASSAPAASASRMKSASRMDMRRVVPAVGERRRRAVEEDPSADEEEALDVALDGAELVGDEDNRRAELGMELSEEGGEGLLRVRVDPRRRL